MLKARLGCKNFASPSNSNHDDCESTGFEPSSPHYSPDSEAPSDVRSTFTSETEEYKQSPFFNEIDDLDSLQHDLKSNGLKRHHPHDDWQCNLNHPVDMPNKRQKIQSLQSISIPATVFMAIDTEKEKPLETIIETDTTFNEGPHHAEATIGDNYLRDLHNISISRDLYIPSARSFESTQIDDKYSPEDEMPEPKADFPYTVESPTMVDTNVEVSNLDRKMPLSKSHGVE